MPIYEYECTSCCNVFEVFQRMTEDSLTSCPDCSGPVKKLVSMSSFQLKGGGWYADGYTSKSSNGSGSTPKDKPIKGATKKVESPPKKAESASSSTSDSAKSKTACKAAA
jgi:putative FmdB family regulatory protein